MYITRTVVGKHTKGQVTIKKTPGSGDAIVAGPFKDAEAARNSGDFFNVQRRILLADNEEIRIHASNGGYLFSVRADTVNGPMILFDRTFTNQSIEYATLVELYPWNKKKETAK